MSDLQCPARIVFVCLEPAAPASAYAPVLELLREDRFTGAWTAPEHQQLAGQVIGALKLPLRTDEQLSPETGSRRKIGTLIGEIADQTRGEATLVVATPEVIGQALLSCPNITPDLAESDPLRAGIRVEVSIDSEGWWCRAWGAA